MFFFYFEQMRKVLFILSFLLNFSLCLKADEVTLLHVADEDIPLSEFTDFIKRANKFQPENVHTNFQYFLRYRLKIADARERKLDTLSAYKKQRKILHDALLKEFFMNKQAADSCYASWPRQSIRRKTNQNMVKLELLTYRLPQHYELGVEEYALRVMNELCVLLGTENLDKQILSDWLQANNVYVEEDGLHWISKDILLDEVATQLARLQVGGYSRPFFSPVGLHVVRLINKSSNANYTEELSSMEVRSESVGKYPPVSLTEAYVRWKGNGLPLPGDLLTRMKRMDDDLLAFYWDKEHKSDKKGTVPASVMDNYFRMHKQKYSWELPHFKGAVIHCASKKVSSKIKKRLKKVPIQNWTKEIQNMAEEDSSYRADIECGLFQIGKNRYVDWLAFKCGDIEPHAEYPYTFIIGKRLKSGPENYKDVFEKVEEDCQLLAEKEKFDALFSHFKVEINEDVLKTVNSCGNK